MYKFYYLTIVLSLQLFALKAEFKVFPPLTNETLNDISMASSGVGVTVGNGGTLIKTDNGENWRIILSGGGNFYTVKMIDSVYGYAAGDSPFEELGFFKTTDGGNTWTEVIIGDVKGDIYDEYFFNRAEGYFVGGNNTSASCGSGACPMSIFYTTDSGKTWTDRSKAIFDNSNSVARGCDFLNKNTGVVVGDEAKVIATINGGVAWGDISPTGIPADSRYNDVVFENNLLLVAGRFGAGNTGMIVKSIDNGSTWNTINIDHTVFSLVMVNDTFGLATCNSGKLYETKDGGDSWTLRTDINVPHDLKGISLKDTLVYMCGTEGSIITNLPDPLEANFSIDYLSDTACVGTTIQLINESTGANSYEWYINDSLFATSINPVYIIQHSDISNNLRGYITFKLVADSLGTKDSSILILPVTSRPIPQFIAPAEINLGDSVLFENQSQNASEYVWFVNGEVVSLETDLNYVFEDTGIYVIELKALSNFCEDSTSESLVIDIIGPDATYINSLTELNFKILPNPNNGSFVFQSDMASKGGNLIIRNIVGQIVYQETVLNNKFLLIAADLPPGIYSVELHTASNITSTMMNVSNY